MADRKSRTTSATLTINKDTVEDCLSSWLTATGFIRRDQFVTGIKYFEGEGYIVKVTNGREKEAEEAHIEKA